MLERLYGVCGVIGLEGVYKMRPVFKVVDKEKYYSIKEGSVEEIDITRCGKARKLPLTKQEVASAEEFLILWEEEKTLPYRKRGLATIAWCKDTINSAEGWQEFGINIAICDNTMFMICKTADEAEMEQLYLGSK